MLNVYTNNDTKTSKHVCVLFHLFIQRLANMSVYYFTFSTIPAMANLLQKTDLPSNTPALLTPSSNHLAPVSTITTPKGLLTSVRPLLTNALVNEVGAVYKFIITGNDGGIFYLDLKCGMYKVKTLMFVNKLMLISYQVSIKINVNGITFRKNLLGSKRKAINMCFAFILQVL